MDNKYIFISYAHKDSECVLPVIRTMQENGFRVWYDDGIDPGTEWDKNIADHIAGCSYFIAFISKAYLASSNCKDEINYARDLEKKRFLVYIENVELPGEMKMRLSRIQNIFMHKYSDKNVFYQKLFAAEGMDVCRSAIHVETTHAKVSSTAPVQAASAPHPDKKKRTSWLSTLVILLAITILGGSILLSLNQNDTSSQESSNTPVTKAADTPVPTVATEIVSTATPELAAPATSELATTAAPTPVAHSHSFDSNYICSSCGESGHTQGLDYQLNDAETYYIVTGIGSASGDELIIPAEHDGLPVKEIANYAFKGLTNLTKLVIPTTIKKIGYGSFADTYNLAEIEYNAVECSDCHSNGVFCSSGQYCNDVRLTIGSEVTRIPSYLFSGGSNLKNYFNLSSVSFQGTKVTEISEYAFYGCKNLLALDLPEGLRTIGMQAFDGLSSLNKLVIPTTVKTMNRDAFANTISLTEIEYNAIDCSDCSSFGVFKSAGQNGNGIRLTIGSEVSYIPDYLFSSENSNTYYTNIASITFQGTKVTEIGNYAFRGCKNIVSLELPEGLKTIRNQAFGNLGKLTTLVIPSTLKTIESQSFANTISLKEIKYNAIECSDCNSSGTFKSAGEDSEGITLTIGSEVTRIPSHLFYSGGPKDYTNISRIIFEGTKVTEIGEYAFKDCQNILTLELPEGIKSIGQSAFSNLSKLTKLVIPSTVKFIDAHAFYNTANLTELEYNAKGADCDANGAFKVSGQSNSGIHLTIGSEVTQIPAYLFSCGNGGKELIDRYYANITSISFEGTKVSEIGRHAFEGCQKLTNITFPKGLKTIKANAFYNCFSLTTATFEEPLTWYAGSKPITEFADPQAAAAILNSYSSNDFVVK